ncbi:TPM domain-containing protein [Cytophagaceae bacterium 50C-KIRBA]|uniref:TPM domain-containing protein n=1 Tax=Aquirufa beregesia TaxID=2516556 RepID=A0ABX0EXF7_9BACT|nr:TPM domain-containing protein [Aquirufa beregesia]NGZ45279.1 TPM domain-containing protein [Aquirufa beregesia]
MHISQEQQAEIIQAIKEAELGTSGEIRVHIESHCEGHPIERSKVLFFQLGMNQTDLQNGVLVYLAIKDRKYAIIGDKGIDARVDPEFWETIRDEMRPYLAKNEIGAGLAWGVRRIGEVLNRYFPYQKDDINELTDELSFGA